MNLVATYSGLPFAVEELQKFVFLFLRRRLIVKYYSWSGLSVVNALSLALWRLPQQTNLWKLIFI